MPRRRRYEYLLSALPGLEALGAAVPLGKQELLERIVETQGPVATVSALFLSDDLVQREALLAGEITAEQADLTILPTPGADDEHDLPAPLRPEESMESSDNARVAVDALWHRYFRYAALVARQQSSRFLRAWVGYEVALRNALVVARAQTLDLDPTTYLVTPDLADRDVDVSGPLAAWSAAPDPLAALEVVDKARWEWLTEHERWFSFQAEEIEAYAAKLMLLQRWRRLATDTHVAAS